MYSQVEQEQNDVESRHQSPTGKWRLETKSKQVGVQRARYSVEDETDP
jgi:hypothetical protein